MMAALSNLRRIEQPVHSLRPCPTTLIVCKRNPLELNQGHSRCHIDDVALKVFVNLPSSQPSRLRAFITITNLICSCIYFQFPIYPARLGGLCNDLSLSPDSRSCPRSMGQS